MGTTASQRATLAAALLEQLEPVVPKLVVHDHGRLIEQVLRPTLLVVAAVVERGTVPGIRRHTLEVWAVVPATEPGASDEVLDELLDQVLEVLESGVTDVVLERAERDLYAASHPAWRITCTRED